MGLKLDEFQLQPHQWQDEGNNNYNNFLWSTGHAPPNVPLYFILFGLWGLSYLKWEHHVGRYSNWHPLWLLRSSSAGLLLSQSSSQPVQIYTVICLWVETFILFISNIMRLQLVYFCILLWSFWIEILPFGMSVNFLPDVASPINLLRVYSVTSSRLLMKTLNNISSSIDPRVALLPLPNEHQAIDYCTVSLAGWQSSWCSTCITVHLHSPQLLRFQVRMPVNRRQKHC